ncbi:outer membrane beta-barrel protein [Novosphingobium sp. RD2P27]|uniref:Outer membrane beta-barrel protein n=1 Tax=Novosphingobium kalidii TaxID=3230299 RepID=A0ABV2CX02_9SPHN
MTGLTIGLATAVAVPVAAQDREAHFDGPYIQVFGGASGQPADRGNGLVFDTDQDGTYGDTVSTVSGADAFSPGFCGGRARTGTPDAGCIADRDGVEYGGRIGYDRRMNNFVVGGLIEATGNRSVDGTSGFSTTPASYTSERSLDYNVSARLRAGYTPGGGMLFYVTGGGGMAKIDHQFRTTNTANSFQERRDGKAVWGWQVGGGGELMVTDQISLGLEYLYNRYDDDKHYVEVGQGTAPATNPFLLRSGGTRIQPSDTRFEYHSLRAVVGFRF